jgi:hypothetical protein
MTLGANVSSFAQKRKTPFLQRDACRGWLSIDEIAAMSPAAVKQFVSSRCDGVGNNITEASSKSVGSDIIQQIWDDARPFGDDQFGRFMDTVFNVTKTICGWVFMALVLLFFLRKRLKLVPGFLWAVYILLCVPLGPIWLYEHYKGAVF